MPSILGLSEEEANLNLQRIGLEAVFILQAETDPQDAIRRAGLVWAQLPPPGTDIDGPMTAWVNPPVVPSILGLSQEEAGLTLQEIDLEAVFIMEAEADPEDAIRRAGLVWAQLPAPGAGIDGPVTAWVNPPPDTVIP